MSEPEIERIVRLETQQEQTHKRFDKIDRFLIGIATGMFLQFVAVVTAVLIKAVQ
jgi:hypothetical protein